MNNEKEIVEKYRVQIDACLEATNWTLTHTETASPYTEKLWTGSYVLELLGHKVACFTLVPMINCCGICVSTSAEVWPNWRGQGIGTLLNSFRIDLARFLGYGVLLCTDIEKNTAQRKILQANGWKDVHKFVNPRTKNTIFISVVNL